MTSVKELYRRSYTNYRNNGGLSHLIFGFIGLLVIGIMLLGLLSSSILLVLFPLVIFPMIFASEIYVYTLKDEGNVTFGNVFRCYGAFFFNQYSSTFRIFKSALKSFLIYLGFALIYVLSLDLSLYYNNYNGFKEIIDNIVSVIRTSGDSEGVIAIYEQYKEFFNTLLIYNHVPTMFIFSISMLFFTNNNSVSFFYRFKKQTLNGNVSKLIHEEVMKKNRKEYYLTYFVLKWPTYVLFIGGFILGGYIGYISFYTYNAIFTLGLIFALLFSFTIYGPFGFACNETIYQEFESQYDEELEGIKDDFLKDLPELIKKLEEEKDKKKDSEES